jgi:hypothetical protein
MAGGRNYCITKIGVEDNSRDEVRPRRMIKRVADPR